VFSQQADLAWLKILKPGFRHCSLLLHDGQSWISYDPLSHFYEITTHQFPPEFNLARWMELRGHIVVPAELKSPAKPAPFGIFSSVEAVKRTLGIHARFVLTPWQLFKYIEKASERSKHLPQGEIAWEV
jgi:hypothetical protein